MLPNNQLCKIRRDAGETFHNNTANINTSTIPAHFTGDLLLFSATGGPL